MIVPTVQMFQRHKGESSTLNVAYDPLMMNERDSAQFA